MKYRMHISKPLFKKNNIFLLLHILLITQLNQMFSTIKEFFLYCGNVPIKLFLKFLTVHTSNLKRKPGFLRFNNTSYLL